MKNKILKISLISLMTIVILVMLTGCTSNTKDENIKTEENKVKTEVQNIEENERNNSIVTQNTSKKDNEIAEELFLDYLKNVKENSGENLKEYKIEKINVLLENERKTVKEIFESTDGVTINEKDIFAEIKYSVKPNDIENTDWIAGNGERQGEWIVNKSACVFIKYDNGTYKIQENGTGW